MFKFLFLITFTSLITACGQSEQTDRSNIESATSTFAQVNNERLENANAEPGQWMTNGRNYDEQRFSPLDQINTENVSELGLAWFADFDTNRGQEATPLVIDGTIYVSTAWSKVYAYDALSGEELWFYDPEVPGEWAVNVCCDVVNRGLAAWEGKIYLGTLDGRLLALDAATGEEVWSIQATDPEKPYSITGAPRVAKGMVLIGQAGAEYGVRGYLSAYDADSGELIWRFYTVPGNPEDGFENDILAQAAETWNGEWYALGGGGTVWDAIVYDQILNQVYIGVGNGSPWNASVRSPGGGDNLFLSSIVAVDADTGEYRWHYQTTPWETWDYTATQPIMIVDLFINGQDRRVIMQAPKNGFFYVLDAENGELISAEAFSTVTWASGISIETGRPIEIAETRYDVTGEGKIVLPGPGGAHSWHPWSYNPETGLVYIPEMRSSFGYVADNDFSANPRGFNVAIDFAAGRDLVGQDGQIEPVNEGRLLAWNPLTQQEEWSVSFGDSRGGGTMTTAGNLVFQGNTANQEFAAYNAGNGEKLWSMPVQTGIVAGASSFMQGDEQYIAVIAGNAPAGGYYAPNYSRLLVFKLGGDVSLPPPQEFTQRPLAPPETTASPELIAAGGDAYSEYCILCHGDNTISRGTFPDLLRTPLLYSQEGLDDVVLNGLLSERGMASFNDVLNQEDTQAIRAYLINQANIQLVQNAQLEVNTATPTGDNELQNE
jgi:quinohemoprotein ethanol dehydrogenase